jgi:hypothetical protein
MALTRQFIDAHIAHWEAELDKPWYIHRQKWPSRLFHHAPIENAVQILRDGSLRSRSDPNNKRTKDVAAAGVIDARVHAHDFARLYFRPRTPTQFHIEGIRKAGECQYGEASHAPVLVMLIFDARSVLSLSTTKFCDRNMQKGSAEPAESEDYFSKIPFLKVFHEGSIGSDRTIIDHRCAEVLAQSPLSLTGALQWICCRTLAERETLLTLLGDDASAWRSRIVIDDFLVFERRFAFVEHVSFSNEGLIFQINPRHDSKPIDVCVKAWNKAGTQVIDFRNVSMLARPSDKTPRWRIQKSLAKGTYSVRIELEGHLAFSGKVALGDTLV